MVLWFVVQYIMVFFDQFVNFFEDVFVVNGILFDENSFVVRFIQCGSYMDVFDMVIGNCLLQWVVGVGNEVVVFFLVINGVYVNYRNKWGEILLYIVCWYGLVNFIVEFLQ